MCRGCLPLLLVECSARIAAKFEHGRVPDGATVPALDHLVDEWGGYTRLNELLHFGGNFGVHHVDALEDQIVRVVHGAELVDALVLVEGLAEKEVHLDGAIREAVVFEVQALFGLSVEC